MDTDLLTERWSELRTQIKAEWPRLSDDDVAWVEGDLDRLIAVIQLHYGLTADEAVERITAFLARLEPEAATAA